MRVEELRIGNIVKTINTIDIFKLVSIGYDYVLLTDEYNDYDSLIEELKPIPITEEWLLKFGFDLINNEYHQSRNHDLKLHWTVNKNKMIPEFNEKKFVTGYDFKYVHQLQNLYFALTGNELICK